MRGLSRWQLPILTVADRSGTRHFQRLPNHGGKALVRAMLPLVSADIVLCSDGAKRHRKLAARGAIEHFVVGSKAGTRVTAGCYHIQAVNSLHARYNKFIRPFCGPVTNYLGGYIRWLEVRIAGVTPAELIRVS